MDPNSIAAVFQRFAPQPQMQQPGQMPQQQPMQPPMPPNPGLNTEPRFGPFMPQQQPQLF